MASEWVKLWDEGSKSDVYVNLINVSSIYPTKKGGSEIWFLVGAGKDGWIQVKESPEAVLALLDEVKSAKGRGEKGHPAHEEKNPANSRGQA